VEQPTRGPEREDADSPRTGEGAEALGDALTGPDDDEGIGTSAAPKPADEFPDAADTTQG
jgi:hypothetical protein